MSIEIIDGFKVIRNEKGLVLSIESDRLEECIQYAKNKGISRIFLNKHNGYNANNVDFFKQNNFFTAVAITDQTIDISGVHFLYNLEYLSLSNTKQKIDFSHFPLLEECSIDWNDKILNMGRCKKLEKAKIWKYKPKSKTFFEIKDVVSLKHLHITESNIESFKNIEHLKNLCHFEGHYLSKVETLCDLQILQNVLKVLVLEHCKKIKDKEEVLRKITSLEKIILTDCGEMSSIKFINELPNLSFFSFVGTNIKDGNMSPCVNLKYAGFDDKRHYSHKSEAIKGEKNNL